MLHYVLIILCQLVQIIIQHFTIDQNKLDSIYKNEIFPKDYISYGFRYEDLNIRT